MKRAVTVPPAARSAFAVALKENSKHWAALPDPLPMGRVLRIVDRAADTEEQLQVLAGKDERGYYLDYYRIDQDRDGETSSHQRILETGMIEELENYEGQWGFPAYDDPARTAAEKKRILEHNTRVGEILRAKGFIK
jgi:hypothetical protein